MGLVCNKIMLEDYLETEIIYSKLIRGNLEFYIELHHLDGGKHLQLLFYRNHPRIKEFIEYNKIKHHLTQQKSTIKSNAKQIKLSINNLSFMINTLPAFTLTVTEYNFNQDLPDFAKGKVAILIDIVFAGEVDNGKVISELKHTINMED